MHFCTTRSCVPCTLDCHNSEELAELLVVVKNLLNSRAAGQVGIEHDAALAVGIGGRPLGCFVFRGAVSSMTGIGCVRPWHAAATLANETSQSKHRITQEQCEPCKVGPELADSTCQGPLLLVKVCVVPFTERRVVASCARWGLLFREEYAHSRRVSTEFTRLDVRMAVKRSSQEHRVGMRQVMLGTGQLTLAQLSSPSDKPHSPQQLPCSIKLGWPITNVTSSSCIGPNCGLWKLGTELHALFDW